MILKIFKLGRGKGKTVRMLYASEFNNAPILCSNKEQKNSLMDIARWYNLNIPEPITVQELIDKKIQHTDILVDEMDTVFESFVNKLMCGGKILASTITISESDKDK